MLRIAKCIVIAIVAIMVAMVAIPMVDNVNAAPAGWNEANILPGADVGLATMAVDANDHVHIAYVDSNNTMTLRYIDDVSGSWSAVQAIDTCDYWAPSLAVDSHGNAYVAYSNGIDLKYATNAGGSWVNTTIETSNMSFAGYEVSIAVDHNDKVGIAYSNTQSGVVKYATNAGGSWVIENVTNASNFECSPSLAFDSANHPYIACCSVGTINGLVLHANTTGNWTTSVADPSVDIYNSDVEVAYLSLCIDHAGHAQIAYETSYDAVNYATNAGGTWKNATVGSMIAANYGNQNIPQIVVDSSNNPSISYSNPTNGDPFEYIELATMSGSSWTTTQLGPGIWQSLGIGSNDKLYAAYDGSVGGNATWGLMVASTGTITPVSNSTGTSVPGPVTSVKVTAGDDEDTITWTAPTTGGSASNVSIYRSSTDSMPSTPLATVGVSSGVYVDHTAVNNNTYYYWVVSSNSNGVGSAVGTGSVTAGTISTSSASSSSDSSGLLIGVIAVVVIVVIAVAAVVFIRKRKMPKP